MLSNIEIHLPQYLMAFDPLLFCVHVLEALQVCYVDVDFQLLGTLPIDKTPFAMVSIREWLPCVYMHTNSSGLVRHNTSRSIYVNLKKNQIHYLSAPYP